MGKNTNYQYYVEGDDEKCILNVLKTDLRCIMPGKVDKFNVVQEKLTIGRIRTMKTGTIVVLIFDTDTDNTTCLKDNIAFLKRQKGIIRQVICIPQIHNLEEELIYSCNIKEISEITQSKSNKDFKRDLLVRTNIDKRLKKCGFSMEKFWSRNPQNAFSSFSNDAAYIKLKTG